MDKEELITKIDKIMRDLKPSLVRKKEQLKGMIKLLNELDSALLFEQVDLNKLLLKIRGGFNEKEKTNRK